jgi:hypothetical protein
MHAEYSDGQHLIHYTSAAVIAGKSVTSTSTVKVGIPTFQLTYELSGTDTLSVTFGLVPPGQSAFQPVATGTLNRQK